MNGLHKFWNLLTNDNLHLQREVGFSVNFAKSIDLFFIDNTSANNQITFRIENKNDNNFSILDKEGKEYSYADFKKAVYEFLLEVRKNADEKEQLIEQLNQIEADEKEKEALAKDEAKEKTKSEAKAKTKK